MSYFYHDDGRLYDGLGITFRIGLGTDPTDADTDGDGLLDGEEVNALGTNPASADTDGDGFSDGYELMNGMDPTSYTGGAGMSSSYPYRGLNFNIDGDYAAWSMTIEGLGPVDYQVETFSMESPGYASGKLKALRKGNSYRLSMEWLNSSGHENPCWYCWQARINGLPTTPSYQSYTSTRLAGNEIVHGIGWMVENASGLLTSHVHTYDGAGGNIAGSLQSILHVYQYDVSICDPDDDAWGKLDASRVILDDEVLRIRVRIAPAIATLDLCRLVMGSNICVKTSGTCPNGAEIPIESADFSVYPDRSEIRMTKTFAQLKSLGILPQNDEDGVDEMAWVDVPEKTGQDLSDSTAFSALGYAFRGKAIVASVPNLEASSPISQRSTSFLKAAGCEVISVTYGNVSGDKRQVMNQADYLYFSGHGDHYNNSIQGGFKPSDAADYWEKDLDVAIIAGCSVLDINDYNGNYDGTAEHTFSPGKAWEQIGPVVLLGYAYIAPGDAGGAPARIMNSWVSNRGTLGDVNAWMRANADNNAWNACAIVKGQKYVYFEKFFYKKFKRVKEVPKGDW